ncbi:ferrous iron transport protein B [Reinekea sp.]|uniref:ferrous iron transport protein B n=1 Tax=Reinekea sp. TaxID=1970455 RepID=UPI00398A1F7B
MAKTIALVGNPNCGKTSLFNQLTGRHQTVGNWPGVTVDKKSGFVTIGDEKYELVDLPGIYSLEQAQLGLDEAIAKKFLTNRPDIILNVVDASALNRQLLLTHQLREYGIPMIVAVNMLDVAQSNHIQVDLQTLQSKLGVPVVGTVASSKESVNKLKAQIPLAASVDVEPIIDGLSNADRLIERLAVVNSWCSAVMEQSSNKITFTEKLDGVLLNRWLGIPIFLAVMYLLFAFAINVGAVFIDFFDILLGTWLVDGSNQLLSAVNTPTWIIVLISNGLGGGLQLVGTFIPVIGFLYVGLSVLEGTGYLPRAAFVVDRMMRSIGLPGRSFVPLIVGFGCNVPSVMATRSLSNPYDRMVTVAMTPFMSCGARLTVYALFAAAMFNQNGQNIVFLLYLLGIFMAVVTGWVFRKAFSARQLTSSVLDLPAFHVPSLRNIWMSTWHRLKSFCLDAGRTIVIVVVALSFINSWGIDGSFGNEDKENSVLSAVSKAVTPIFYPLGVTADNWPATVGIVTGIFAKEAVVGTLDSLYADIAGVDDGDSESLSYWKSTQTAFASIMDNARGLAGTLVDPLGLSIGDVSNQEAAANEQGVRTSTLSTLATLFETPFAAFCYLVFILLYTPCVAMMGALVREAGRSWSIVVISWSTILAYSVSTSLYQIGTFHLHAFFSASWLLAMAAMMWGAFIVLKRVAEQEVAKAGLIPLVSVEAGCH